CARSSPSSASANAPPTADPTPPDIRSIVYHSPLRRPANYPRPSPCRPAAYPQAKPLSTDSHRPRHSPTRPAIIVLPAALRSRRERRPQAGVHSTRPGPRPPPLPQQEDDLCHTLLTTQPTPSPAAKPSPSTPPSPTPKPATRSP